MNHGDAYLLSQVGCRGGALGLGSFGPWSCRLAAAAASLLLPLPALLNYTWSCLWLTWSCL